METLLSVGFCFTAKTPRLHKLGSTKSVRVPIHFSLQEAGQHKNVPGIDDDSKEKLNYTIKRKHNLSCLFIPFLNLFNS